MEIAHRSVKTSIVHSISRLPGKLLFGSPACASTAQQCQSINHSGKIGHTRQTSNPVEGGWMFGISIPQHLLREHGDNGSGAGLLLGWKTARVLFAKDREPELRDCRFTSSPAASLVD